MAAALVASGLGLASSAQATAASAYSAIQSAGVLSDTATGATANATLNGTSLADGVTLKGAGNDQIQTRTEPDDPSATVVSTGADGPSAPTTYGGSMSISLPASTSQLTVMENGAPVHDGTTGASTQSDFSASGIATAPTALTDTDAGVQSVQDGVRMLSVTGSASAPHQIAYNLSLPAGAQLIPSSASLDDESDNNPDTSDVTYIIVLNDHVIGDIEAPWAKDANGAPVPTTYALSGNQLIQNVSFTAATAFPVVADPHISFGWWIYIRFSKAEVQHMTPIIVGAGSTTTILCGFIPNHSAQQFCKAVSAFGIAHMSAVFGKAWAQDRCVELKFRYSPVYSIKSYAC